MGPPPRPMSRNPFADALYANANNSPNSTPNRQRSYSHSSEESFSPDENIFDRYKTNSNPRSNNLIDLDSNGNSNSTSTSNGNSISRRGDRDRQREREREIEEREYREFQEYKEQKRRRQRERERRERHKERERQRELERQSKQQSYEDKLNSLKQGIISAESKASLDSATASSAFYYANNKELSSSSNSSKAEFLKGKKALHGEAYSQDFGSESLEPVNTDAIALSLSSIVA